MKNFNLRRAFGGGGNGVKPSGDDVLILNSSSQRGEEAIQSEQTRTLGVQVRGISSTKLFKDKLTFSST